MTRTLKVDALARVEGEGALKVRIRDGRVTDLEFRIFEPPRFFEAFLEGRDFTEAPDITARICGICPIAYLLGASKAMEDARGVTLPKALNDLRRVIYCGEWIESHVLHAAMLHAPDFLGLDDALQIAKANPELVKKALRLKKLGNSLLDVIGGRAVHPIGLKVGGFWKVPASADLVALLPEIAWALDATEEIALAFGGFDYPELSQETCYVSLGGIDAYPIEDGRVVSDQGHDCPPADFLDLIEEVHVKRSNALHARFIDGTRYVVGPLARFNNNRDHLTPRADHLAGRLNLGARVTNPFKSILVRLVETMVALEEAERLIKDYRKPAEAFVPVVPGPGEGVGITEAPRGICFHGYQLDAVGRIVSARIIPPTSQNQPQIEWDLARVVEASLDLDDEALTWRAEQTIRNYDPCISCATHFLDLDIDRGGVDG
ncbi:MAG: Ni/Fe hydrogenase subunit alpha [Magnetovibrionaceae bacterium]